jgi:hypothetical protein
MKNRCSNAVGAALPACRQAGAGRPLTKGFPNSGTPAYRTGRHRGAPLRNSKGISVLFLIIAMLLMVTIGYVFSYLIPSKQKSVVFPIQSTQASFIAQSGAEFAVRYAKNQGWTTTTLLNNLNGITRDLGSGRFTLTYNYATYGDKLISVGEVPIGTQRREIVVSNFTSFLYYFAYHKSITVQSGQVSNGPLTNFPMLVSMTDPNLATTAYGGHVASYNAGTNDPWDIVFLALDDTTCGGTGTSPCKLNHEIETYVASTGQLVAWVGLPSINNGTVIYMYYGNSCMPSSTQNASGVWDSNYKGVWHLKETGTGVSGEYKDSTSSGDNGTLTGVSVLKASYNMTTSANSYLYEDLTSVTNYTTAAGDYVEYDVYWTSSTDKIAFDFTVSTGATLRDSGAIDQNGLSAHPATDISARALNKWYHRKIAIPASLQAKTIVYFDIACECDLSATKTAYLDNITITNGGLIKKLIYSSGDSVPYATHLVSNGAINSFGNASDPTSSSASGEIGNALNNAVRYVNMTGRATNVQDNWTIEAWINPGILNQFSLAVYNGNDAGGYGFGIGNGAGDFGSKLSGLYGFVAWIDSGYTFPSAGAWYHVVMTRASGTAYFYVNGTQTAGTSVSTPNAPNNYLTIGNQLDGSNTPFRYFNGIIDEVRISSTPRSADWIKTEYNNQKALSSFYSVGLEEN